MKLLDGEVAPGDALSIDADMKKGTMTFTPSKAKAAKQA
jgi:type III secretory pathway component EscV